MTTQTLETLTTTNLNSLSQPSSVIPLNKSRFVDADGRFVEAAKALPEAEVLPCRTDVYNAIANVIAGVTTLEQAATIERIKTELPKTDVPALLALPELGQAVMRAVESVPPMAKGSTMAEQLERGMALRGILRSQLDLLVALGDLNPKEIAPMKGRSAMDVAKHLTLAAEILARCGVQRPLMVGKETIEEARSLGMAIRDGAASAADQASALKARSDSAAMRDRLWTLFVRGHKELRRVARYLWDEKADSLVPPMISGRKPNRKAKAPEATDANPVSTNGPVAEQPAHE